MVHVSAAFFPALSSILTNSSISRNSADVVFLLRAGLPLPCAGLRVADRPGRTPRSAGPPTLVVMARLPRPEVMVEANEPRVDDRFSVVRGELACSDVVRAGVRGEPVRSVAVLRRSRGPRGVGLDACDELRGFGFEACDELRDVEVRAVGVMFVLLVRRTGSRGVVLGWGPLPKIAGSMGLVRAR